MYESLRSQFFRTTTGTPSGPDALGKSRLIMTFLANLCSFRLVLKEKAGQETPELSRLEFL